MRDAGGAIVWQSPELDEPIVEVVKRTVRIIDFETGRVVTTYDLKPGEELVRD